MGSGEQTMRTNIITQDGEETLISCIIIRTTPKCIVTKNVDDEEIYLSLDHVEIISSTIAGLSEISVPNWLARKAGIL